VQNPETFRAAIRAEGKAVDANLAGFEAGVAAIGSPVPQQSTESDLRSVSSQAADFDAMARPIIELGVARLLDYQNPAYAQLYLDRLQRVREAERQAGGDGSLLRDTARQLAVRMAFDDVIRVAQMKIEPTRLERVRHEVRAKDGDPLVVIDYFKPGIEEICSLLPSALARPAPRAGAGRPRRRSTARRSRGRTPGSRPPPTGRRAPSASCLVLVGSSSCTRRRISGAKLGSR
jgi:indolepyruvate ferredoxin oxidoreductase, beta subunit